ncbi:MAG: hypothetical protein GY807_07815, partial [Gammaproteobacteria bacterium]|nr:hypothetical protein [Gammaproteobacteria bacterium]
MQTISPDQPSSSHSKTRYSPDISRLADANRRVSGDRRTQTLWAHINTNQNFRKRCSIRREANRHNTYLDRYKPLFVYITLGVLLLSCVDATFTLALLQRGSVELNPLMAWLIDINPHLFVAVKLSITGLGVLLLLAHTQFRVFRSLKVVYLLYLS